MTARELIVAWLREADEPVLAQRVSSSPEGGFLDLPVGSAFGPEPIRYVESWSNEASFVWLRVERD